mgnify:CR=1 FL=1
MGICTIAAKELESLWSGVVVESKFYVLNYKSFLGKGKGTCRMRKRKGIKKSLSMLSHAPDFQFSRMLFEIIQQLLLQNQLLQNLLQLL